LVPFWEDAQKRTGYLLQQIPKSKPSKTKKGMGFRRGVVDATVVKGD